MESRLEKDTYDTSKVWTIVFSLNWIDWIQLKIKKNLLLLLLFFNSYFPNTTFFLLYSMETQLHIHVHILLSHIIMLLHKQQKIIFNEHV